MVVVVSGLISDVCHAPAKILGDDSDLLVLVSGLISDVCHRPNKNSGFWIGFKSSDFIINPSVSQIRWIPMGKRGELALISPTERFW